MGASYVIDSRDVVFSQMISAQPLGRGGGLEVTFNHRTNDSVNNNYIVQPQFKTLDISVTVSSSHLVLYFSGPGG